MSHHFLRTFSFGQLHSVDKIHEVLNRPKIYLDEPIQIEGYNIGHTREGLKYLIDHYEHILTIATPKQLSDKERTHIETKLLIDLKFHLSLYKKCNP